MHSYCARKQSVTFVIISETILTNLTFFSAHPTIMGYPDVKKVLKALACELEKSYFSADLREGFLYGSKML